MEFWVGAYLLFLRVSIEWLPDLLIEEIDYGLIYSYDFDLGWTFTTLIRLSLFILLTLRLSFGRIWSVGFYLSLCILINYSY